MYDSTCTSLFPLVSLSISRSLSLSYPLSCRHIANCSHWVQQDAPEQVNQFMREFLQEWTWKLYFCCLVGCLGINFLPVCHCVAWVPAPSYMHGAYMKGLAPRPTWYIMLCPVHKRKLHGFPCGCGFIKSGAPRPSAIHPTFEPTLQQWRACWERLVSLFLCLWWWCLEECWLYWES